MSTPVATAPRRPLIRYHGGKWRIAPWIIEQFPPHRVYTESFGGGASVLLRKPRAEVEVYNDLDGELVSLFRVLRNHSQAALLTESLRLTPFSREELDCAHELSADPVEQARRTLCKAWMAFGAGALTHRHAGFRVALIGRRHTAREWSGFADHLEAIVDRLQGVFIEHRSALDVVRRFDAIDALHFIDPPYLPEVRGPRHRYRHELSIGDHCELASVLSRMRGAVVVCGYASPLYDEIYSGWQVLVRSTTDAASRKREECLWIKPAASVGLGEGERQGTSALGSSTMPSPAQSGAAR